MSEDRSSDYPQVSYIRKSPFFRGVKQTPNPETPPPPTEAMANMVVHGARTYDPLPARQIVTVHEAPLTYPMTYASRRTVGHGARPDYDRGSWTKIMIIHSAVV
jgi:hypothetical protein